MEISPSLLVSIMFVIILSMGIGNILGSLASIVDRRSGVKTYGIHTSWVTLLLLVHFNLFWRMVDIFTIENWEFFDFLIVIGGPILLFFATNVLTSDSKDQEREAHYYSVSRQFFFFVSLLQLWSIVVDFVLGKGFTTAGGFSVVVLILFSVLANSAKPQLHKLGNATAWILFLIASLLRGLDIMQ